MTPSEAEVQTLEPGDIVLQKYKVEHRLGQGGMGYVVAVRHIDLGELFAMKVLLNSALARPGSADRFLREARSAARLKTDHVVRVYDIGKLETDEPYILMEYLRGKDLADLLEEKQKLPAREVVDFMLEALDAIAEAHALGVVHRDLKPSNLFVAARRDDAPALKVLDFGISKELNAKDQATTHSASLMGSPYYMSPEHMRSAKHVGPSTDIWSLGIIMFELLTGRIPFEGDTPTEVCARVLEMPVPSILEFAPATPPALVDAVLRCLRRVPEERYTAEELKRVLGEVSDTLGDAPRSLLSSGSWLKARVSLSGMTLPPPAGTTSDPAARARADLDTIDQSAPLSASDPRQLATPAPVKVSTQPSIQGWSQSPRVARRISSSLYVVAGIVIAFAAGWAIFLRGGTSAKPTSHSAAPPDQGASTESAVEPRTSDPLPAAVPPPAAMPPSVSAPAEVASSVASVEVASAAPPPSATQTPLSVPARPGVGVARPSQPQTKPAAPPTSDTSAPTLKRPKF